MIPIIHFQENEFLKTHKSKQHESDVFLSQAETIFKKETAHWGQQKRTSYDMWTDGDLMHDQVMIRWQVNMHQLTCDNWMP